MDERTQEYPATPRASDPVGAVVYWIKPEGGQMAVGIEPCPECGAAVFLARTHREWHARQENDAR